MPASLVTSLGEVLGIILGAVNEKNKQTLAKNVDSWNSFMQLANSL